MEEKFGFRSFGFPPKTFNNALKGTEKDESIESIKKLTSRPNSFSFNIQKFLNIKQEEIVEDEVQEYKVTTSQNDKERDLEEDRMEEQDEEEKSGVVVDDTEDNESSYRSLLLNSYPFQHQRKDSNDEDSLWSRKMPGRQKNAGDRLLDIPCKVCGDRSSGKHYGIYSCDGKRGVTRDHCSLLILTQLSSNCFSTGMIISGININVFYTNLTITSSSSSS